MPKLKKRKDGLYQMQVYIGLDENKKRVVKTVYGKTQKEVADMLGISQSYISRLEKRIISKMKKEILSKTG